MRRNKIILTKIILLLEIFKNAEVIQLFYLSPESILALKMWS